MSEIFFSIIVPTFNSALVISECLESIRVQSCQALEVIVMDNLSTDGTQSIVSGFSSFFPLSLHSRADMGVYDAMNKAIGYASGRYLYFLGSDDSLYDPDVLSRVRALLEKEDHRVAYGNVMMRGSNAVVVDGTIHGGAFDLKRLFSNNICHQAIFYHRSVFAAVGGYDMRYPVYADHDLNLRCAAAFPLHYMDLIVANFAVGGKSTQLTDSDFVNDKPVNIARYFFKTIHTGRFVGLRMYIRQAALTANKGNGWFIRTYYAMIYLQLKLRSFFA